MTTVADSVPSSGLDLGYCGVNQVTTKSFTLYNPTTHNVRFEISTENCPFDISPSKGILQYQFQINQIL